MYNEELTIDNMDALCSDLEDTLEEGWKEFNKEMTVKLMEQYHSNMLKEVRYELMLLVKENASNGISKFSSKEYLKTSDRTEPNPYNKLTDEEIDSVIADFEAKGINISVNGFSRSNTVTFNFNLLK